MGFDVTHPANEDRPARPSDVSPLLAEPAPGEPGRTSDPWGAGERERRAEHDTYEERLRRYWEPRKPRAVLLERDEGPSEASLGIPPRPPVRAWLFLVAGGIAAVVLLGFILWGSLTGGAGRTAPDDEVTGPAVASPPAVGAVGEPLRVGTLAFLVHGLREVPAGRTEQPASGMRWVAVEVEVVNEGSDEAAISMLSMFDLEDSSGAMHLPTLIGSVERYAEGDLPPGLRLRGEVVFEVPEDAAGFTLVLTTPDRTRTGRVAL